MIEIVNTKDGLITNLTEEEYKHKLEWIAENNNGVSIWAKDNNVKLKFKHNNSLVLNYDMVEAFLLSVGYIIKKTKS